MIEICARCKFWEFSRRPEHDFATGECHRHAPRPQLHVLSMIARHTGETAVATSATAGIELEEDYSLDRYAESVVQVDVHEWPVLSAHQWCGDFASREAAVTFDTYRPQQYERLKAAEDWEREHGLDGGWRTRARAREESP